jgi:hypothetical protein
MFTVIMSWQHTLECDIKRSFSAAWTYNQMLSFQCHSCFVSITGNYTPEEYADMHLIRGEPRGIGAAAVRLYAERCPQRRLPNSARFTSLIFASTCTVYCHLFEYILPELLDTVPLDIRRNMLFMCITLFQPVSVTPPENTLQVLTLGDG